MAKLGTQIVYLLILTKFQTICVNFVKRMWFQISPKSQKMRKPYGIGSKTAKHV
jgi:hypothetical protein